MQGFLQVDDDLTAVGESQGDHAAHALVIDVGLGGFVDLVALGFDPTQQGLSEVQKFRIGHGFYNLFMHKFIVWSRWGCAGLLCLTLLGCGQYGPLYLPDDAPRTTTR